MVAAGTTVEHRMGEVEPEQDQPSQKQKMARETGSGRGITIELPVTAGSDRSQHAFSPVPSPEGRHYDSQGSPGTQSSPTREVLRAATDQPFEFETPHRKSHRSSKRSSTGARSSEGNLNG